MSVHDHASRTWDDQAAGLERSGDVSYPWVAEAVAWVTSTHQRPSELIIDAGCGAGFAARAFALAAPSARVLAVDQNARILEMARRLTTLAELDDRVRTVHGDLEGDISTLGPADIVWASAVIHHLSDPVQGLTRIGGAVAAGGILAVAEGGLPMRVLPGGYGVGRPSFLSRLEATLSDYFVREWSLSDAGVGGGRDWRWMLAEAGFTPLASRTFLLDRPAPVADSVRDHIREHYLDVRSMIGTLLDVDDRRALDILLDDDDARSIARREDLFLLTAHTVHLASPAR